MKALLHRMLQLFILLALVVGPTPASAQPKTAASEPSLTPLADLLQADGTLDLHKGFSGSLDPRGWRMVSQSGQPPRFVRAGYSEVGTQFPAPRAPAAPGDEFWDNRFDVLGVSGYVYALAVSGDDVYVGGLFSAVGYLSVNNIARWNSATGTWSALGEGVGGYVYAIAVSGSDVYVGGRFNSVIGYPSVPNTFNIAKWNGSSWSALGEGVMGYVYAIAVSGSDVYVGGRFDSVVGYPSAPDTYNIARWNTITRSWSAVGQGIAGYVYAIAVSGSEVYVGGMFPGVVGYPSAPDTINIAMWNSTTGIWSSLDKGVAGYVYDIAISGDYVYVGGLFSGVNAYPSVNETINIARWNRTTKEWSALGKGVAGYIYAIAVSGDEIYVGGLFNGADVYPSVPGTFNIARWNSTTGVWSALGSGVSSWVYDIAIGADGVYVGGLFNAAGDKASRNFGRWYGNLTVPPTPCPYWDDRFGLDKLGIYGRVYAIAVSGDNVYVGGYFSKAGSVSVANIARWDGSQWWALGSGIDLRGVYAIAVSGSVVYVGGNFNTAGGVTAYNVAKWDGSQWSALGSGLGGNGVYALAVVGNDLYAGGNFGGIGGPLLNIAKWDGSRWSSPGGIDGYGLLDGAMAVSGSNLYLGGSFSRAGTTNARNIARWDGSRFWALGSGANDWVTAIAVSGSDVYAGGVFTTAGGVSANRIARWDGSRFWALGSGVGSSVSAIAARGNEVYAGGGFTTAGGVSANRIARWDGSHWSPLCSGIGPSYVSAIAVSGSDVYVGGNFGTAGGKPSNGFAIYHAGPSTLPGGGISGRVTGPGGIAVPGATVQVCRPLGGPCQWLGTSDSAGIYTARNLPAGAYIAKVYPPANSSLRPNSRGSISLPENTSLSGQDIVLRGYQPMPSGISLIPSQMGSLAVPRVRWSRPLALSAQGCAGGSASYQITQAGAVLRSGALAESPSGRYYADIAPLLPYVGDAEARVTIQCPGGLAPAANTLEFDLYIESEHTVRALGGRPIADATVTLFYYDVTQESFLPVPSGDPIMGPLNRANPDTTNESGSFGWDLSGGIYKIRAEKEGCVAPGYPEQSFVESDVLVFPQHFAFDLDLVLDCGKNNVSLYLPVTRR